MPRIQGVRLSPERERVLGILLSRLGEPVSAVYIARDMGITPAAARQLVRRIRKELLGCRVPLIIQSVAPSVYQLQLVMGTSPREDFPLVVGRQREEMRRVLRVLSEEYGGMASHHRTGMSSVAEYMTRVVCRLGLGPSVDGRDPVGRQDGPR